MIRLSRAAAAVGAAAVLGLAVPAARAVIPSPEKLTEAVAQANRSGGRAGPVLLEVTLTIGDGPAAATGVLATHPTGLARLELRSHRGFVERHLLQGSQHTASRDGELIERPRHFLPPVFLLQATSGAALSAALGSFGIAADEAVLGRVGDYDCYVFGGRLPPVLERQKRLLPSMWVDLETYEVVRIDGTDGVRYRFGPTQDFDGIRVPRWIAIEAPGEPPARLDIVKATQANAPAAAFGRDWLSAPPAP
ncbi:MAG: hypothetical protein ACE5FL_13375 [Myxococcota bacterium]